MSAPGMRVCVDVGNLEKAVAFYTRAFGFTVGRRFDSGWAELLGGALPLDLLVNPEGSTAVEGTSLQRTYARHWTPLHLDFTVPALDEALKQALEAGAVQEGPIRQKVYGRIVQLKDPFGNGLCLLELQGKGYDAL